MTAEVKERHRRAALEQIYGKEILSWPSAQHWLETGDDGDGSWPVPNTIVYIAEARAAAEERGRIEERVRCAEAASNVDVTSDWTIRRWRETFSKITCASIEAIEAWEDSDDTIKSLVLDAARKELGL